MELLVAYDVDTTTRSGERRLRMVAKACEAIGHRVQKSVFEVVCEPPQRLRLEAQLQQIIDPNRDSIRIYQLPKGTFTATRHLGAAINPIHYGSVII